MLARENVQRLISRRFLLWARVTRTQPGVSSDLSYVQLCDYLSGLLLWLRLRVKRWFFRAGNHTRPKKKLTKRLNSGPRIAVVGASSPNLRGVVCRPISASFRRAQRPDGGAYPTVSGFWG